MAKVHGIKKSSEQENQLKGFTPLAQCQNENNFKTHSHEKTFTPEMMNQCKKFMYSFFDYLPVKYAADNNAWKVRRFIWAFKDGQFSKYAASLVAKKLLEQFGADCENMVFVCVPASSHDKNEARYHEFSEEVSRLSGIGNAFTHVSVEGERLAIHESKGAKHVNSVQVVNFDKDFFAGKKVLVFDDVITRGYSYSRFACALESLGASVIGGIFLAKTLFI